ncbi:MAG: hypothetical protein V4689_08675 [Verrucomicrobiota bacterium]
MIKPSPQNILAGLLGGALGAAGILQALHWQATRMPSGRTDLENQLRTAGEEIEMLKRENESLRSLAQGGGKLSVPPEFIDRIEREFGLRFLTNPVIHRITAEELRDRIAAAVESRFGPSGIDDRQLAYSLIGWLRPGEELLTQLTVARSADVAAWFDDATGEGWMPEKSNLKNVPDQAALVGLLTRILFHQHFPTAADYPGDDAHRAREALHQGTAAGAEARFYTEKARTAGFMPMKENKESKQLLASLSPFIQGLTGFPAVEGKGYADSLYLRGNEALHAAFRNPPRTTAAILDPGEPAFPAIDPPATPETPFLTESAGQLGLLLRLNPLENADAAIEISSSWKNDRYVLFPDGENSTAVLWDIELDSPAAADSLQAMGSKLTSQGGDENEKRHVLLVRISPTRIRFLNTAEAATAARFGPP